MFYTVFSTETMNGGSQLKVSLEDLLNAREKGLIFIL